MTTRVCVAITVYLQTAKLTSTGLDNRKFYLITPLGKHQICIPYFIFFLEQPLLDSVDTEITQRDVYKSKKG